MEASKYLDLSSVSLDNGNGGSVLENRIWQFKSSLDELELQRSQITQTFGSGHSKVKSLDQRIAYYRGEMESMQKQLDAILPWNQKICRRIPNPGNWT